jgi:hypothetical protein
MLHVDTLQQVNWVVTCLVDTRRKKTIFNIRKFSDCESENAGKLAATTKSCKLIYELVLGSSRVRVVQMKQKDLFLHARNWNVICC